MPLPRKKFCFWRKFLLVLLAAVIWGLVLAMIETGRSPGDLLTHLQGIEPYEEPETPVARRTPRTAPKPVEIVNRPEPAPEPPRTESPRPEPPKTETPRPPVEPAPAGARMQKLFADLNGMLAEGRFREAMDRMAKENPSVPEEYAEQFHSTRQRIDHYHRLLQETVPGAAVPVPELSELSFRNGSRMIVVKNVSEADGKVHFETLDGIWMGVEKSQVRELSKVNGKVSSLVALDYELEQWGPTRGISVQRSPGRGLSFSAGERVSGLAFFEVADYCARNGNNARLLPLFDEALRRDPDLLTTVHEWKARNLTEVLFYFVSIRAKEDAKNVLNILETRYRDTWAYRERLEGDPELTEAFRNLAVAAPKPPRRAPDDPPPPAPETGPNPPDPAPQPPVDESEPAEPTARPLPAGAPESAVRLVGKGDGYYDEAMTHLRNSSPNSNRSGWAAENKKALELFGKAVQEYQSAVAEFDRAKQPVPEVLNERIREAQMSRFMCRKRAVSEK